MKTKTIVMKTFYTTKKIMVMLSLLSTMNFATVAQIGVPVAKKYIACPDASLTLKMQPQAGVTFYWYADQTGGVALAGPSDVYTVTKDNTAAQTWWVEARQGATIHPRLAITVGLSQGCGGPAADWVESGTLLFREDFGGNSPSDPAVKPTGIPQVIGYSYNIAMNGGDYTIAKSSASYANGAWYKTIIDHTYPDDPTRGYFLGFNAADESGQFYECRIDNLLCDGSKLYFSAWAVSLLASDGFPHKANHIYLLEDLQGNVLVSFHTGNLPEPDPTWRNWGFEFIVPVGETSVVLKIINNGAGTSGNDFLLDDIQIHLCVPPVVVTSPAIEETNVCQGGDITLTAAYTDDDAFGNNLQFRWEKNVTGNINNPTDWTPIPGTAGASNNGVVTASQAAYTINNFTAADDGYYRLAVVNNVPGAFDLYYCRAMSNVIKLTYVASPNTVGPTGPFSVCLGATTTLTPTTGGTWTSSNPSVATVDNAGVVTSVAAGTTTFTFNSTSTGCSNTTGMLTVITPPTAPTSITGTLTICSGHSTTLTASGGSNGDGATYQWGTGACGSNVISGETGNEITVDPSATTTYWVRRIGISPCVATSCVTQQVTVNPTLTPSATITATPNNE